MSTELIPADATPFPSFAATPFPQVIDSGIEAVQTAIHDQNAKASQEFLKACVEWTATATRNRDIGVALPPKPLPPPKNVLYRHKDDSGTTWLWERAEGTVAPPCADLPPLPVKPSGVVVAIGVSLGGGWYQSLPEDNAPDGHKVVRPDGTYVKVRYPFGGWWQKVS